MPHSARIWNYWLGGKDNYAVDREAGDQYKEIFPAIAVVARTRGPFSPARSGTWPAEAGIRQFLDIGTGLPTANNTHEVAQPSRRNRGSSTWTTIPWCWRTPAPC